MPSEDSDQPGHPPSLIRVFAVRMKKGWILSYPLNAQRRLRSDWADAQADLSLRRAHSHFVGFVTRRLKISYVFRVTSLGKQCRPRSDCSRSCLIQVYTFCHSVCIFWSHYCNFPKFSDRQVLEQSDQSLHCLQSPLHLLDALL